MKRPLLLSLLLPVAMATTAAPVTTPKIYKVSELRTLIKSSAKDSTLRFERATALEFHRLINEYRRSKGSDTLAWNDTLWLAARNHSNWMAANNELSHDEREGTPVFSGTNPGDRYAYATNGNGKLSWSGENALYDWSTDHADNIQARAEVLAQEAFNSWKESKGHNANMLAKNSKQHGVAFILDPKVEGKIWATDLFAYGQNGDFFTTYTPNEEKKEDAPVAVVKKKTDAGKARTLLMKELYDDAPLPKDEVLAKAAAQHSKYMANGRNVGHDEVKGKSYFSGETPRKRVLHNVRGLKKFRYRRMDISESIATIEVPTEDFDAAAVAKQINDTWAQNTDGAGGTKRLGISIDVKRVKDKLKISAVKVEG